MKTLTIRSDGSLEFNFDGYSFNTDLNDPCIPEWASQELQKLFDHMTEDGCSEIHFENNGFQTTIHEVKLGICSNCQEIQESNVFANLGQFVSDYEYAFNN